MESFAGSETVSILFCRNHHQWTSKTLGQWQEAGPSRTPSVSYRRCFLQAHWPLSMEKQEAGPSHTPSVSCSRCFFRLTVRQCVLISTKNEANNTPYSYPSSLLYMLRNISYSRSIKTNHYVCSKYNPARALESKKTALLQILRSLIRHLNSSSQFDFPSMMPKSSA